MWNKTVWALLVSGLICYGQENRDDVKFYRLDFVVKEVDGGKVVNARNYSMTISNEKDSQSSTRSGDKVPLSNGNSGQSYYDMGVNIDCRQAREVGDRLALNVSADISGAGAPGKTESLPVIRSTRWSSKVLVPLRKPTVVFSSDDATKTQMQLELTATPMR